MFAKIRYFMRYVLTFICGTDSPVNMASSTIQEPRSNTISQGTSISESLDLPEGMNEVKTQQKFSVNVILIMKVFIRKS